MFFALVDRDREDLIANVCVGLADESGSNHGPYYVFESVNQCFPISPGDSGVNGCATCEFKGITS